MLTHKNNISPIGPFKKSFHSILSLLPKDLGANIQQALLFQDYQETANRGTDQQKNWENMKSVWQEVIQQLPKYVCCKCPRSTRSNAKSSTNPRTVKERNTV